MHSSLCFIHHLVAVPTLLHLNIYSFLVFCLLCLRCSKNFKFLSLKVWRKRPRRLQLIPPFLDFLLQLFFVCRPVVQVKSSSGLVTLPSYLLTSGNLCFILPCCQMVEMYIKNGMGKQLYFFISLATWQIK